MRPELVAGLALALAVALSCLAAALFAGAGLALALLIYSLSGSAALFAGALWVAYRREVRGRRGTQVRAARARSVLTP